MKEKKKLIERDIQRVWVAAERGLEMRFVKSHLSEMYQANESWK